MRRRAVVILVSATAVALSLGTAAATPRSSVPCGSGSYSGCVIWFGLSQRLAPCKPACAKYDHWSARFRSPTYVLTNASGTKVVASNIELGCGNKRGLAIGGGAPTGPVHGGRFSNHYHFRNRQSGDTVDTWFNGRFSGDTFTGKAWGRYHNSPPAGSCQSGVFAFSLQRLQRHDRPWWWPGHYSAQFSSGRVDLDVGGDALSVTIAAHMTCDDGSSYDGSFTAASVPIPPAQSDFQTHADFDSVQLDDGHGGQLSASLELMNDGTVSVNVLGDVKHGTTVDGSDIFCNPGFPDNGVTARDPQASGAP